MIAPARQRSSAPVKIDTEYTAAPSTVAPAIVEEQQQPAAKDTDTDSVHKDILSAIYSAGNDQQKGVTARDAAAANLDKWVLLGCLL